MGFHGGQTESCAIFRLRDAALLKATVLSHYFVGLLDIQNILTTIVSLVYFISQKSVFCWFTLKYRKYFNYNQKSLLIDSL